MWHLIKIKKKNQTGKSNNKTVKSMDKARTNNTFPCFVPDVAVLSLLVPVSSQVVPGMSLFDPVLYLLVPVWSVPGP